MRKFLTISIAVCVGYLRVSGQDPAVRPLGYHFEGPRTPADFPKWLADMKRWRAEYLKRIGYNGSEYDREELKWTQRSFMQPQMMVEDRYFFDPSKGKYTVERYLNDLEKRYGGIDSVLVWPTYPNIGIDDRSQFDLFRDMPGGMPGIKQMVADFHRHGVRVLFPMMLWDQGTRDFGLAESQALAEELAEVGADGINGDTMGAVPREYRIASDKTGHPLAFEPEALNVDEALAYNNLNWGQAVLAGPNAGPPPQPGGLTPQLVSKFKWLERRHLTHISDRWQRDKNIDLQYAFFNGIGMETWENIWGIWNEMTPRDSETVRRIAHIQRKFADQLTSADWEPHTPMLQRGIYASKWPGASQTVWTIVNKNEFDVSGPQIELPNQPGRRYFDLFRGVELSPEAKAGTLVLSFPIEASGYGALLAMDSSSTDSSVKPFLNEMGKLTKARLDSFSALRNILPQKMTEIAPTKSAASAPAGMLQIPAANYKFHVSGIEIEGENQIGVDVQYPWENVARRDHESVVPIKSFFIDRYPVTNAEFKKFLDTAKYRPRDDHNLLKDWKNGDFPQGWANKPVTWVSLEDARAYASWAGKRLPHEWEWQYAAQGTDGRLYPSGDRLDPSAVPVPEKGRTLRGPDEVSAHPRGASPFGVEDLTGNVWQWTDEYTDDHTRAGILRGGSYYQPQGSRWYFPQAYKLNEHGKLLLMASGKDRAGTVGFRCVVDSQ